MILSHLAERILLIANTASCYMVFRLYGFSLNQLSPVIIDSKIVDWDVKPQPKQTNKIIER